MTYNNNHSPNSSSASSPTEAKSFFGRALGLKDISGETFLLGFFLISYAILIPLHLTNLFSPNIRLGFYVVLAIDGIIAYRLVLMTALRQTWQAPFFSIIIVVVGYIGLNVLTGIVGLVLKFINFISGNSQNENNIAELANNNALPLLLVLGLGVAGPIVEELVFRQFLIGFLERYLPAWVLVIISSIAFGMMHMHGFTASEWLNASIYIAMGFAFGIIYTIDRNVWLPIAVHIWLNLPLALAFLH